MKAICPNNENHKEFVTSVNVVADWKIDSKGNYLESLDDCVELIEGPNQYNTWECIECGANAIFIEE